MGAMCRRMMRRNAFTFGANRHMAEGRYFCRPAICEKNSCVGLPSLSLKMFLPVLASTTLWWMCIALPGSRAIGFDMNVAYILWRNAASGAVRLDQRVDLDLLRFAERVDVVEQRVELVDRGDAVRLPADLGPPRAADR